MSRKGCLIAVCGIDGSGKTVQTEMLCRRARQAGWTVHPIEFPRYREGHFGGVIARYLRGDISEDPAEVDPYLAALPFACDRWQAAPELRRWLREGALVVCNRYVPANLAHQGGKIESPSERQEFRRWVEELEYEVFELPRPDLHLWLDMPPELAAELISRKPGREYLGLKRDIHEISPPHLRATWEVYRELAEGSADWLRVQCEGQGRPLPREQIAEEVWRAVGPLLARRGA